MPCPNQSPLLWLGLYRILLALWKQEHFRASVRLPIRNLESSEHEGYRPISSFLRKMITRNSGSRGIVQSALRTKFESLCMEVLRFASLMWKFMDAETAWMAQIQNQSIATWMRISRKASGQNCMHFEVVNKTFRHCLTSDKMLPKFMCSIAVLKLGLEFPCLSFRHCPIFKLFALYMSWQRWHEALEVGKVQNTSSNLICRNYWTCQAAHSSPEDSQEKLDHFLWKELQR